MKILISVCILSLLTFSPALAKSVNVKVPANKSTVLGNLSTFNSFNCDHGPIPNPKLTKTPSHGKVTFKRSVKTLSKGRCKGKKVKSTMMTYTPNRGFRGKDTFKMNYSFDKYATASTHRTYVYYTINLSVK